MLTLAVAESGPGDAVLAERCRRLLVARQPNHWFATTATIGQALANEDVARVMARLRTMFPAARVQRSLLRGAVQRGPFTGRTRARSPACSKTSAWPPNAWPDSATRTRRRARSQALLFPSPATAPDDALEPPPLDAAVDGESLAPLYLAILLAMAVLIQSVLEQSPCASSNREPAPPEPG